MKYFIYILSILSLNFFSSPSAMAEENETRSQEYDLSDTDWKRGDWGGWSTDEDRPLNPDTETQEEHDAAWEYNNTAWGRS